MRRLVLFRHAKSDHPAGIDDYDRPLAPRGRAAARGMAHWLVELGIEPDLVLSSGSARARETWWRAKAAFDPEPETVYDDRIYEAPLKRLLNVVGDVTSDVWTLVLIGHNPGVAELAGWFVGGGADENLKGLRRKFPTGAVAVVDFDDRPWADLGRAEGWLSVFATPKSLGLEGE